MENKVYEIALHSIKGIGPVALKTLLAEFDSAKDIFHTNYKELIRRGIQEKIVKAIVDESTLKNAEKEFQLCKDKGIQVLFYQDDAYPQRLNYQDKLAPLLYYRGTANLNQQKIVSIVGTREPSKYGSMMCEKIIEQLTPFNCLIVSGLAYGIDIKAHKTALKQGMETVGVMASGLAHVYPSDHLPIAKDMSQQGGLLSEFTYHTEAEREHFPMRNKIVAAMSDVVIVVQSGAKGGSLITAEFANAMGKDVFAIPGRVNDKMSAGCNAIIKQHKAHLMESVEDIKYIMRWDEQPKAVQQSLFEELSDEEMSVLNYIKHHQECHIDQLSQSLQMSQGILMTQILQLELKGLIKALPGKHYITKG